MEFKDWEALMEAEGFEGYLKRMSQNGSWGDGVMIEVASLLYGRPVVVVSSAKENEQSNDYSTNPANVNSDVPTITLGFCNYGGQQSQIQNHYVSLLPNERNIGLLITNSLEIDGSNSNRNVNNNCAYNSMNTDDNVFPQVAPEFSTMCSSTETEESMPSNVINTSEPEKIEVNDKKRLSDLDNAAYDGAHSHSGNQSKDTFSNQDIPECWSHDQYKYFIKENDWLIVKNRLLGCSVCREVKSLGPSKSQGLKLQNGWMTTSIAEYGDTKEKQQNSLRKKIFDHHNSEAHLRAVRIKKDSTEERLRRQLENENKDQHETTCRIFRTVYKELKQNRPFTDLEDDIDLQVLNGIKMGRILQSRISCSNISKHIGEEMRRKLLTEIINMRQKISVLIDESTTVSKKTTMIVYIRTVVVGEHDSIVDKENEPVTFFLDLIELSSQTAAIINAALLTCLHKHGMTDEILQESLVGFACDGASVMLGRKAGVAALLIEKYPRVLVWHCFAHRVELCVEDTLKEVAGTNNFKTFMDKLYTLYSMSPKNRTELKNCAKDSTSKIQLKTIGKVLSTRWVASSLRTVSAVWDSFPALHCHFLFASKDQSRDSKERSKFQGMATHISSNEFLRNLGLMYDALQELSELSLALQRRTITIPEAHREICRQIKVFEAMSSTPGEHYNEASLAVSAKIFRNVPLHVGTKTDVVIHHAQFFVSLCTNLKKRLLAFQSSNVPTFSKTKSTQSQVCSLGDSGYNLFIDEVKVLYPINWPDEVDINYGTDAVSSLARRFNVEERITVRAFREYTDNGGKKIPTNLKPLLRAVSTVPVCTAECERGFSLMNLINTPTRNKLDVSTMSALMFAKAVGPPLRRFKPISYVKSWLAKGSRSADDLNSKVRKEVVEDSNYEQLWGFLS